MKAVILAAGMGTRLGTLIPKPLTSIKNEKTIMDYQVERLSEKVGRNNIIVVVGYKKELIMEKFPDLTFVYNPAYAQTNTSKSLHTALRKIDDDVIWMNGDVFFQDEALDLLLDARDSSLLVDTKKCGDEEIKYTLDDSGNIASLSKQVEDGLGESVGVNLILRKDIEALSKALDEVENQDYFEKAIENLVIDNSLVVKPIALGDIFCQEIDFESDLQSTIKQAISLGLV